MKYLFFKTILTLGLSLTAIFCYAEQAVIVHPSNSSNISTTDIKRIYLAKIKSFPGGTLAIPLNHKDNSDARVSFDSSLLGKNPDQMKSYWAKLIFTGKATPLKQVDSDVEVIELVANNPGAIGYVDAAKVTGQVKVIHKF